MRILIDSDWYFFFVASCVKFLTDADVDDILDAYSTSEDFVQELLAQEKKLKDKSSGKKIIEKQATQD